MNFLNNINLLISDLEKLIQEIKREFNVKKINKKISNDKYINQKIYIYLK